MANNEIAFFIYYLVKELNDAIQCMILTNKQTTLHVEVQMNHLAPLEGKLEIWIHKGLIVESIIKKIEK